MEPDSRAGGRRSAKQCSDTNYFVARNCSGATRSAGSRRMNTAEINAALMSNHLWITNHVLADLLTARKWIYGMNLLGLFLGDTNEFPALNNVCIAGEWSTPSRLLRPSISTSITATVPFCVRAAFSHQFHRVRALLDAVAECTFTQEAFHLVGVAYHLAIFEQAHNTESNRGQS